MTKQTSTNGLTDIDVPQTSTTQEQLHRKLHVFFVTRPAVAGWEMELENFIATELAKARKEVNDEWMNQKANDHDARIRADERARVIEVIKKTPVPAVSGDQVTQAMTVKRVFKTYIKAIEQMGKV